MSSAKKRPYGAREVRAAVLTAARKRFALEGPTAALRDIAADAQVNLGLLHRHFGSKAALLGAVLTDMVDRTRRDLTIFSFEEAVEALIGSLSLNENGSVQELPGDSRGLSVQTYARIIAWMLLTGEDPRTYQKRFTFVPHAAELAGPGRRGLLLVTVLCTFGWYVFGRHLSSLIGYESDQEAIDDLAHILRQLLASTKDSE